MNTMNALITATFFVPVALMVATNLLTARTMGPSATRRMPVAPLPTNRVGVTAANEQRYLEAA